MDSVKLKELEQARRRVVEGEKTLSRQREVVAKLEAKGYDATVARQMVQSFEKIQAINVNTVERLRKEMQTSGAMIKYRSPNVHKHARVGPTHRA